MITWHDGVEVGEKKDGVDAVVGHATEPAPPALLKAPEGTECSRHPRHIPTKMSACTNAQCKILADKTLQSPTPDTYSNKWASPTTFFD